MHRTTTRCGLAGKPAEKPIDMKTSLLQKPASRAARELALRFLKDAEAACRRLADPDDIEALHDFRVALRRLRSIVRAYTPHLKDALPKKLRKRIGELAAGTGTARDTEVQLAWLVQQRENVRPHEQPGYHWIVSRLEHRRLEEYADLRERLPTDFARLRDRLKTRLELNYDDGDETLGEVTATLLLEAADEFHDELAQVHSEENEEAVHRARIAAKRLRYLLEPLAKLLPDGKALVRELKEFQEIMGEVHDVQVFGIELRQAAEEAGAERMRRLIDLSLRLPHDDPELEAARHSDERAGLIALAHELHERRLDLCARLLAKVNEGEADRFFHHLEAAVAELRRPTEETSDADEHEDENRVPD
jgi:CHAD domain-containing protein